MSSDEFSIHVHDLGKCYSIFAKPQDRLKQALFARGANLLGREVKTYSQDFWALSGVSFDVRKGETVGIVGRNGSGKSTLLQMICGTVTPTTGTVRTHGRVAALLELGAGFNPEFTGRENVFLNASLLGLTHEQIDSRFDQIAGFADIGTFIESPVRKYSSGMFARLAFSVAVHTDPEILIVDEILAVGDAAFQRRCLKKFYDIRDAGCSILFVSHDQYQVKSICNRALYLSQGRQVDFGAAGKVIDRYTVDMQTALREFEAKELAAGHGHTASIPKELDVLDKSNPEGGRGDGGSDTGEAIEPDKLFTIDDVWLTDEQSGERILEVETGQDIRLNVAFHALTARVPDKISFVFNLYRHDDLYICGTTTLMDGMGPHDGCAKGVFTVKFRQFPLVGGSYKWRVAINDEGGFIVHADAVNVCLFQVTDNFEAVGIVSLPREWEFSFSD
ncbi:ABC transporter ATP-binding protein [Achromobacter ruhlandii]|uniref:ABC transporter ATP-binding protein n=1 Tax=Achromobacter ruhlandii TaxID=72557 RepID=UPI0006C62A98|nr:ABC transporter ATP-binding protein [Achromobacter ruhlandii]AMG44375.1 ABC transporter ATP-binding protein [Achromobacter xylosoxidans]CUJ29608.1 Teichoic acids export ATP-binding protein TagH [Achromobacter ruhlandii]CUJ36896.1 Teichoic acids export ATP-binding protein TagH [Achromobacter ruhlandii]CUK16559.1 Teichoic acids export ATP-binding protein TagH [Achromobacter ruhlandii]